MTIAYIGVGSNLGRSQDIIKNAIDDLQKRPEIREVKSSAYYLTDPVGNVNQDQFINAILRVETTLEASALLKILHQLEAKYHRQRTIHWGPRTLDLDIELFDQQNIQTDELTVPHPEMLKRLFVLVPLLEVIEPDDPRKEVLEVAIKKLNGQQYIQKLSQRS